MIKKIKIYNIKECILYDEAREQFEMFFNSTIYPRKSKLKLLSIGSVCQAKEWQNGIGKRQNTDVECGRDSDTAVRFYTDRRIHICSLR